MSPKAPEPVFEDGVERPLAAELVLGLVQGEERNALLLRLRDDPVFADEVSFWETRFSPLIDRIAPVEPPEHVWTGIADHIHPPTVPVATLRSTPRTGFWHSLPVWRGIGFAASGLAAACLALLLFSTPPAPPKTMFASLNLDDGRSAFMATVDKSTRRIVLVPAGIPPRRLSTPTSSGSSLPAVRRSRSAPSSPRGRSRYPCPIPSCRKRERTACWRFRSSRWAVRRPVSRQARSWPRVRCTTSDKIVEDLHPSFLPFRMFYVF